MKILHIVKLYYPWIGGVEKVAQEMVEGIKREVDVRVLCCQQRGRGSREHVGGVMVVKAGSLGTFLSMPVSLVFPFLFRAEAKRADILHFHSPFPLAGLSYLFFAKQKNKKIVITWHSDIVRQKKALFFFRPLLRRFLKLADIILPTSQNVLDNSPFLKEFAHKCRVMPLFIDTEHWKSLPVREVLLFQENRDPSTPLRFARDDEGKKIILFVGRLVYYKGVEYLIEAMKGIDAILLIVGGGVLEKEIKGKVQVAGLEKNILFIKNLSDQELKWCYQHANIFVLPSVEKTEAFGLVQLEAMLFGVPVINTSLSTGVPSVSLHNETGLTVPPRDSVALRDAIQKLLSDESLARTMGESGKKRAEEVFGKKKAIADLLRIYNELSGVRDSNKDV